MAKTPKGSAKSQPTDESGALLLVVREGTLIALLAIAGYFLMALFSYSAQDPSWSATGDHSAVRNTAGMSGAWFSDVLFSLFGYTAYLIPFALMHRAWLIFRDRYDAFRFDGLTVALKLAGLILVLMGFTCLLSLSTITDQASLPFGSGGYLGSVVKEGLLQVLHPAGTVLLMLAITLFGLTLFAEISWLALMDRVGASTVVLIDRFIAWFIDWNDRRRELARQHRRDKEAARLKAPAPVIKPAPIQAAKPAVIDEEISVGAMITQIKQSAESLLPAAKSKPLAKKKSPKPVRRERNNGEPLEVPDFELLDEPVAGRQIGFTSEQLTQLSGLLETKLADFGIKAEVKSVLPGPVVTRFEIQPAAGVKVSRISNLAKDLARSLAVISVRIVEVIPGKSFVGIEIPNENRAMVMLSEVLTSPVYTEANSHLTLALGHDIAGEPIVADLAKMPHLLVAGTTGSGKSVGVNAMLLSLLYKATPDQVRLILIDPKMLELSVYEGIPHLLTPVITDMKDAANGLRWCVAEMERRYKLMAAMGVRNLEGFNKKITDAIAAGETITDPVWQPDPLSIIDVDDQIPPDLETLPHIVVVIDEFADMIMIVGKKVEQLIARIAQKARAAGIHLVLATQRPSVDVITGLIKANVPTRIAFQVSSRIDSRTILDQGGAEQLLGHGDMLYLPPGSGVPIRVHGAFVSDDEVHRVADDWRARAEPDYLPDLIDEGGAGGDGIPGLESAESSDNEQDALYDEAVMFVTETRKASISSVQRKLRIGYNRAARMIESMEAAGVISEMQHNGSREVIAPPPPRR
jgi:S-DNA-T family DNA segregation ATPase FtsK/SpoIIIE